MDRIRGMKFTLFLALLWVFYGGMYAASTKKVKPSPVQSTKAAVAPEPIDIFKNATFLLPKGIRIAPRWIIPPSDADWNSEIFSIDQNATPWIGRSTPANFIILQPTKEYAIAFSPSISNFLHLKNGVMLLISGNSVGFMAKPGARNLTDTKIPKVSFQPIISFPLKSIEAVGQYENSFYCAGLSPTTKRYSLYALRSLKGGGLTDMELLYESEEAISAIAANAESIYIAKGQQVVRINRTDGAITQFYTHPSDKVIDIVPLKSGVLIGTSQEVVYAGENGTIGIFRSTGQRIILRQNVLYIFFSQSLGVLALDNIEDIERFNFSVKPVSAKTDKLPISLGGVKFFESGAEPYTQKIFADSFDKSSIRRIVAQIDFKVQPIKQEQKHTLTVNWYEPTGGRLRNQSYSLRIKPSATTQQLFAAIGEEPDKKGYIPRTKGKGGLTWILGKDSLGLRYPGRYQMDIQLDGSKIGEWYFTISGKNTFFDALFYDDLPMIKTILDQTPINEYMDQDGNSFLNLAIEYGSVEAVRLILDKGINPNVQDGQGKKPLEHLQPRIPEAVKKAELLVKHGANINDVAGPDQEPIIFQIYDDDVILFLIKNGVDLYKKNKNNQTVIDRVAFDYSNKCSDEFLSALSSRGIDLNMKSSGFSPYKSKLGLAITASDYECVERLLKRGVSTSGVQSKTYNEPERSALYVALKELYERTIQKYGRKSTEEEMTNSRKIVHLLMDKGAKLAPGKKHLTTRYFEELNNYSRMYSSDDHYKRFQEEDALSRTGEGRVMFQGESPLFFSREEMVAMLEADDSALDEASRSNDESIRQMALYVQLDRVRELVGAAKEDIYLSTAHDHCKEAFKIAENRYKPMQLNYIPDQSSLSGKGMFLLPREEGGAYVQKVVEGEAAAVAGLLPGDIILAVDTQKVKKVDELRTILMSLSPGLPVVVTILRANPSELPELPLTCGILEYARKEKNLAQMNLGQWLNSKPTREETEKMSSILENVFK